MPILIDETTDEKVKLVTECRKLFGVAAARELMVELGFPMPPPEMITPIDQLPPEPDDDECDFEDECDD